MSQAIPPKMKAKEPEPEAPLSLWPFVKMTAPVFLFGVILPFADIVTDLRLIIRLYIGVWRCTTYNCRLSQDRATYCQENPGECDTEKHTIFATMFLGREIYNLV